MDALCRLDYQAASQYCTWKLLETTWKCFVSFWMASAIESLSLLSSLSRCNQNWTHTIMHHAFKTWCIVSTNGRYAIKTLDFDKKSGVFLTFWRKIGTCFNLSWPHFDPNSKMACYGIKYRNFVSGSLSSISNAPSPMRTNSFVLRPEFILYHPVLLYTASGGKNTFLHVRSKQKIQIQTCYYLWPRRW